MPSNTHSRPGLSRSKGGPAPGDVFPTSRPYQAPPTPPITPERKKRSTGAPVQHTYPRDLPFSPPTTPNGRTSPAPVARIQCICPSDLQRSPPVTPNKRTLVAPNLATPPATPDERRLAEYISPFDSPVLGPITSQPLTPDESTSLFSSAFSLFSKLRSPQLLGGSPECPSSKIQPPRKAKSQGLSEQDVRFQQIANEEDLEAEAMREPSEEEIPEVVKGLKKKLLNWERVLPESYTVLSLAVKNDLSSIYRQD